MADAAIQRSFAGGELAPGLLARADLAKYQGGLRTCRNLVVRRHGGVANRPGTQFVAATKYGADTPCYLYPFEFAAAHLSTVIEAGDHYFRFHKDGAPVRVIEGTSTAWGWGHWATGVAYAVADMVESGGVIYYCLTAHTATTPPPDAALWYPLPGDVYEIPSPYPAGVWQDPARACWSQQGLVLTITHLNHVPRELVFRNPSCWLLRDILTAPSIAAPTGGVGGPHGGDTRDWHYVVTAAKAETYEESLPSALISILSAPEATPAIPHVLTWDAVPDAVEYYIYGDAGFGNNTFGYLATVTDQLTFNDTGFVADFSLTPPIERRLFDAELQYPAVNTVYQQRRVCAGTHSDREMVYASQTGYVHNFSIRSPLQDDDAITFRLSAEEMQVVTHLLSLRALVMLTNRGAWLLQGDEAGVLRPTAINPRQHAWTGAAFVRPVVIGESIIFVQAQGTVVRDLRFDQQVQGFRGVDLTRDAAHLFAGYLIDRLAYAEVPDSIVWAVRTDGTLLGLTYLPEDEVWGWHRHDTLQGVFEDVCAIDEGPEDSVYLIVRRTVNGTDQRYIERLGARQYLQLAEAYHVDCGVTQRVELATATVTGLDHLDGASVLALADGVVRGPFTVSGGTVTLPAAASVVHVGLPITVQLETLTLDVAGSTLRDKRTVVTSVALLVEATVRNFRVGPTFGKLYPVRAEAWDTRPWLDGRVELTVTGQYQEDGRVVLEHTLPTPLTVLAVLPHVAVGG